MKLLGACVSISFELVCDFVASLCSRRRFIARPAIQDNSIYFEIFDSLNHSYQLANKMVAVHHTTTYRYAENEKRHYGCFMSIELAFHFFVHNERIHYSEDTFTEFIILCVCFAEFITVCVCSPCSFIHRVRLLIFVSRKVEISV